MADVTAAPELRRRSIRAGWRAGRAVVTALVSVGLGACSLTDGKLPPVPLPTASTVQPLTVMSTDPIRGADPAAVTDAGSAVLSLNVFQRLMSAEPGEGALKPDAARDCLFTSATTYTCTLNKELFFHNGDPLTAADVKFSVERAARLDVPGSSAPLLSSLRRIETPDPFTIRFLLSRVDTQFGWALASPSASIVNRKLYDADEVRPSSEPIVGSGPFAVISLTDDVLRLARYEDYVGRNPAGSAVVIYRTARDSASIEEAMRRRQVDVVWRGLSQAAITRFLQQAGQSSDEKTADGYVLESEVGVRVRQLVWAPRSSKRGNQALRQAVEAALQTDRTLDSIVPGGVDGHVRSFPTGGRGKPKVGWSGRVPINLSYDSSAPDARDVATQIRTRLEDTGGISVQVRPNLASADLMVVDRKAWTATAVAWLQPYLEAPLPESRATLTRLERQYRAATSEAEGNRLLSALQRRAAVDRVVLPVSQTDEYLFVAEGADISESSFGPGWQLGLFGMQNA